MISFFFSQKYFNYLALLFFLIVMSVLLIVVPRPDLTSHSGELTGWLATVLTETAGPPFFLVTVGLLCLIPVMMRLPAKTILRIWIQFGLLLVLSFGAKTGLKHVTEIPRPYTYELQKLHLVESPKAFYQLEDKAKNKVVTEATEQVSSWRTHHWQGETNYSFPSGHTIFAAVCVLFWGGFFLRRRKYLPAILLVAWAVGVGWSRLWLGMHWPSDLMGSIGCAGLLYLLIPEQKPTISHSDHQKLSLG